ncbi:phage portal protein [Streptomyces sp. NPDC018693]|uniref:phage portal protein n=1 Tax=unclassified Streptomyces TaxID=2593676 RepID=UPI003792B90D
MSLWWSRRQEPKAEERTRWPEASLEQVIASLKTQSYAEVDLSSAESALQSVAVYAAVDLIASVVSELPLDVYRETGDTPVKLRTPGYMQDPDGSGQGLEDWTYRAVYSWLMRGNVYGDILQRSNAGGFLQQIDLFHPDAVGGSLNDDGTVHWLHNGRPVPEREMFHRRVNPVPGYVQGLSPIQMQASTIGLSLTASRFGLQWFQDGAHPTALLTNSEATIDEGQARGVKDRFLATLRGRREPLVMGKGWDYKPIQLTAEESQFLATQGYSQAECARIFGAGIAEILGYETGGSMTYANIQDRELTLLKYAIGRWIRRMERIWFQFLPRPQYARYNRDALLETNTMQRYQAHGLALDKQWKTVNEVREKEELAPVPWGDRPNAIPGAANDDEPEE